MSWIASFSGWLDLPVIKLHSYHATGTLSSVGAFKLLAWAIGAAVPLGMARLILEKIESVVLVTIFLQLAIQLLVTGFRQTWLKVKGDLNGEAQGRAA
jgi:hypothetical protein